MYRAATIRCLLHGHEVSPRELAALVGDTGLRSYKLRKRMKDSGKDIN